MSARNENPTGGAVGQGAKQKRQRHLKTLGADSHYEALKSEFSSKAMTPAEYSAACRRAARIAGV